MRTALILLAMCAPAQVFVPPPMPLNINSSCTQYAMSAASHRVGMRFITAQSSVTGMLFRVGTVTSGGDVAVRLYAADANGWPTGTPVTIGTASVTATGWYAVTTTAQPVTPSTLYVMMLEFASYTSQNFTISLCGTGVSPYTSIRYDGAAWSASTEGLIPGYIIGGNGKPLPEQTFVPMFRSNYAFGSGSTPDERGIACTLPAPMRVSAVRFFSSNAVSGSRTVEIYEAGTNIASVSAPLAINTYVHVAVPVSFVVKAGVEYIISVKPSTTSGTGFLWWDMTAFGIPSGYRDTTALFGQQYCHAVYRTDGGSWTHDSSVVHPIYLVGAWR